MMMRRSSTGGARRQTFGRILEQVADENAGRLMAKARLANRVAKSLAGTGRRRAYRVKAGALITLSEKFPERVEVRPDAAQPGFVVVTVRQAWFGLHAPDEYFPRAARETRPFEAAA